MINPLRRRNRGLTPEQAEEVQKLVFELVRERLGAAFGGRGMWTVSMKNPAEVDAIFSETVAESLAWEIAAQLAPAKKSRHQSRAAFVPAIQPAPAVVAAAPAASPSVVVSASAEEFERLVA